ncbi:hypothetical protein WMF18_13445 [Sorangium sp. So ce315]|uniref:hypothetical protein n=1 Tax=Sorangium sp. So ce315 TaxID=3133299 RepID=UPI003F6089DE
MGHPLAIHADVRHAQLIDRNGGLLFQQLAILSDAARSSRQQECHAGHSPDHADLLLLAFS